MQSFLKMKIHLLIFNLCLLVSLRVLLADISINSYCMTRERDSIPFVAYAAELGGLPVVILVIACLGRQGCHCLGHSDVVLGRQGL